MKFYHLCLLTMILLICSVTNGQNPDSSLIKPNFYIIPSGYYQPETNWAFGVAGAYYFKSYKLNRISSIAGSAYYTLNNQFLLNASPKIYFDNSKWYVYSSINLANYPDTYYDLGNAPPTYSFSYVSKKINVVVQPQYEVSPNLYVGAILSYRYESTKTDSATQHDYSRQVSFVDAPGWKAYQAVSLGFVAMFDKRNSLFYSEDGYFAKFTAEYSPNILSTYSYFKSTLDLRYFHKILGNHSVAFQFYGQGIVGGGIPFQLLSTFGGSDLMRGVRSGFFKDNSALVLQSEYRLPIYKNLKGAVFASIGDVLGDNYVRGQALKASYGLGLRYKINAAGVHIRLDVAKNSYETPFQFYMTASEAF